mgnify:CR=1 FL=1
MNTEYFTIDYTELDETVEMLFPEKQVPGFSEIICGLMDGEIPFGELFSLVKESGYHGLFYGIAGVKELIFIAVVAAVFYILSKTGRLGQASQTGFFVTYLLIVGGMFRIFDTSRGIVGDALNALLDFMKALIPAYCTGITIASGGLSASVFYHVAMLGIGIVGTVLYSVVLPATGLYFMLSSLNRILEDNVCGLIVEGTKSSFPSPNLPLFEELRSRGVPMVFLNGYYREFSQCGVFQDDVSAGKLLTEHLLENGHRKFAAIFKADDLQGLKRFEGMSLALTEAGIPIDDQRILWYTTEDIPDLFSGEMDSFVLKRLGDATALLCYNDQIGAAVTELLKRAGRSVLEDISLVSVDNSPLAADLAYGFTSAIYPSAEIGSVAAKLLLRCIRDNTLREHVRVAADICYRSSVRNLSQEEN